MKVQLFVMLVIFYLSPSVCAQQRELAGVASQLDKFLVMANRFSQFNGSVLVCYQGNIILEKGYGFKNIADKTPSDKETIFRIGSVTKGFTSTLILLLEEQGKLSVQDKLSTYFPDFLPGQQITIHHLLSHTSGLYDYASDMDRADSAIITNPVSKEIILKQFMQHPLSFPPGSNYSYSNSGYFLLGMIIEKVTGKSWEENIRQYILGPLNMRHSGFDFQGLESPNKPIGYQLLNDWTQLPDIVWDSTVAYAAGALYSNTRDMLAWAKAVTQKKILTTESWAKAFTENLHHYGYGWELDTVSGVPFIAHNGGIPGFSAELLISPENDLQVIVLSNVHENTNVTPISKTLATMVLKKSFPYGIANPPPIIDITASDLKSFVGKYQFDKNHVANIMEKDGKLFIESTTNQISLTRLFPAGRSDFFMANIFRNIQLTFKKNKTGEVTGMTIIQGKATFKWEKSR